MQTEPASNNQKTDTEQTQGFSISGRVKETCTINIAELKSMDTFEVSGSLHACGSGEPKGHLGTLRGVLLSDIINKAPVLIKDHNDTKKMFIIASSDDGYTTVFSWQEIFNTSVGEGIMVMLEKDGLPVHGGSGLVDIFSANDFLTGPRYLKRLSNIEIKIVE